MFKKIFFLISFLFISTVNATVCNDPKFKVNHSCLDNECYSTNQIDFWLEDTIPEIINDPIYIEIDNFKNWYNSKIDYYSNNLNNFFKIEDFCKIWLVKKNSAWNRYEICLDDDDSSERKEGWSKDCYYWNNENHPDWEKNYDWYACIDWELDWNDCYIEKLVCEDEYFKFKTLIEYTDPFTVDDSVFWADSEYLNWTDYFFKNHNDILSEIDVNNIAVSLDNMFPNYIDYDIIDWKSEIEFRNVCDSGICLNTSKKSFNLDSTSSAKLLNWTKETLSTEDFNKPYFVNDSFEYSTNWVLAWDWILAWSWVSVSFKIKDLLPNSWCDTFDYSYKISYAYKNQDWSLWNEITFVEDVIKISTDWEALNDSNNLWWYEVVNHWYTSDFNTNTRIVTININEWANLTKAWEVFFFVEMENYLWKKLEKVQVNNIAVTVYPNWVSTSNLNTRIERRLFDYNVDLYPRSALHMRAYLYDTYWNNYCNIQDWIRIYNSNSIGWKLLFFSNWDYSQSILNWLNSLTNDDWVCYFDWQFTYDVSWSFDQRFNISIPVVNSSWDYDSYDTHTLSIYENGSLSKYFINEVIDITWNNYSIPCSTSITLSSPCRSDSSGWAWRVVSWCNNTRDPQTITFNSETQNWSEWDLTIRDKAYNPTTYHYIMAHIDRTKPLLNFINLPNDTNNLLASNNKIRISVSDLWRPTGCVWTPITVTWRLNWVTLDLNWSSAWTSAVLNYDWEIEVDNSILKTAWEWKVLSFTVTDSAWNTNIYSKIVNIYPNLPWNSSSLELVNSSSRNSLYANVTDNYEYKIKLIDDYWNIIDWSKAWNLSKVISNVNQTCNWITWCSVITIDETSVDDSLENVLHENISWNISSIWESNFTVKSPSPGIFTENFEITLNKWNNKYETLSNTPYKFSLATWNTNSFKKPFTWELLVSDSLPNYDSIPKVSTSQYYKLNLVEQSILPSFIWRLNITEDTIINKISWHSWDDFIATDTWLSISPTKKYWTFDATINSINNILSWALVSSNNLVIEYTISWYPKVKYYLSQNDSSENRDEFIIWGSDRSTLWLKVVWTLQWDWKSSITWQEENFSDLSKWSLRADIRKNAYIITKWLDWSWDWEILDWIRYVEWSDVVLSTEPSDYETLIVKNWNVIITDTNFNQSWKKFWIIVLKDGFDVKTDYDDKWNIYIDNDVLYINAALYADGWLITSNYDWSTNTLYDVNNSARTSALQKQLVIKWSLFTRNTIGWSVLAWWIYKLPGWWDTSSFDLAMIYDLNYLRVWNHLCKDLDWDSQCISEWEYNDQVVIIHNSNLQYDPPKWFGK